MVCIEHLIEPHLAQGNPAALSDSLGDLDGLQVTPVEVYYAPRKRHAESVGVSPDMSVKSFPLENGCDGVDQIESIVVTDWVLDDGDLLAVFKRGTESRQFWRVSEDVKWRFKALFYEDEALHQWCGN